MRKQIRKCLEEQTKAVRKSKNESIFAQLECDPFFQTSKTILFFASLPEEVDTIPMMKRLLKEGRCVLVPYLDRKNSKIHAARIYNADTDLAAGCYGIREPKRSLKVPFDPARIDLVLVPGVAFGPKGFRLGRGKGYYDRFLHSLPKRTKRYGLAFDIQMVQSVPIASHDMPVDRVIVNR